MKTYGVMRLVAVCVVCFAPATSALGVEFNLVDPALEQQDDGSSMSLNVGGIDAILSTNIGTLNVDGQEFGIASSEDGEGEGRLINGAEELSITFYEDVRWDAFYVWNQHENGCSVISTDSVGGELFCGAGLKMSHGGVVIPAGDPIRLFASDSAGFSLATFAVSLSGDGGSGDEPIGGAGGEEPTGDEGPETEPESGSENPIVRIEHSGSGSGSAWFEYFDNANNMSIYLGAYDTAEATFFVEAEVPLGEGIYVYESADDCSISNGLYYADGSPVTLNVDGRYGPITINEDTTLTARFVADYLACGTCVATTALMVMAGLGLTGLRRRIVIQPRVKDATRH